MRVQEGDWEKLFSTWERLVVIYVGAAVMYLIGKRLKKRHNLLDDVRQSPYQQVRATPPLRPTKSNLPPHSDREIEPWARNRLITIAVTQNKVSLTPSVIFSSHSCKRMLAFSP